ncbi:MAG TPA: HAMP domain-containing sensor histidine kinase [Bryobacteraceae bacterium]|nr:HAMP domain-containing sensor histidine kinase [Bryobacteraceae bacterium]
MEQVERRTWLAWVAVGVLAVLCAASAILQNRWISEVSRAERETLQQHLQGGLNQLARDFDGEIATGARSLQPSQMFTRLAVAVPREDPAGLILLDPKTGRFGAAAWPEEWSAVREELDSMRQRVRPPPPGSMPDNVVVLPRIARERGHGGRGPQGPPGPPPEEQELLIAELNLNYARNTLLPELLRRYLGDGNGKLEYDAEVIDNADSSKVIFQSASSDIRTSPDAWVDLFRINLRIPRFGPGRGFGGEPPPPGIEGPPPPGDPGPGRWRLMVRHQAGSLEAVVARARWQNLATSIGILLLILATVGVMVHYTRRSQRLAELQMNFVAGVSHELRTPLTVIRTAAFNLRRQTANRPEQVERYGALIQEQSERLGSLVEEVLNFSSARAGHVIRTREPLAIADVIDDSLKSSHAAHDGKLVIEKHVEAGLPRIVGDPMAMKQALQNLVENAVKYGTEGSNWIGVTASRIEQENGPAIEVRVSDRGPGIPPEEQAHIFDPFYRGRNAVAEQIHGTGLGLNLVKKIVEAHGGTIRVRSEMSKGTEFVVCIPTAPPEQHDELAHSTD